MQTVVRRLCHTSAFWNRFFEQSSVGCSHSQASDLCDKLIDKHDRGALAKCITYVESRNPSKRAIGDFVLSKILQRQHKALESGQNKSLIFRIGISGSPGAGKSSFIEAFGQHLINEHNMHVAVLTIDPSSQKTGGSLLGDITRMQMLSRNPNAFVRASPTRGTLGGVTVGTREAILLCEGAGYDVVLIETVGVGQSETAVSEIADMLVVLLSPAQGDELQGFKKGLVELSDLLLVTKSDGDMINQARITQAEYISALKFTRPRFDCWRPKVLRVSAHQNQGLEDAWVSMQKYWASISSTGTLQKLREDQLHRWMWHALEDQVMPVLRNHPTVQQMSSELQSRIAAGDITPLKACEIILKRVITVD